MEGNCLIIVLWKKLLHFIEKKTESLSNTIKGNPWSVLARSVATNQINNMAI